MNYDYVVKYTRMTSVGGREMKINKGNILKSACEYVREARQLEEEYKLMGSKLQDFDKVAQCLLSRINVSRNIESYTFKVIYVENDFFFSNFLMEYFFKTSM